MKVSYNFTNVYVGTILEEATIEELEVLSNRYGIGIICEDGKPAFIEKVFGDIDG